MDITFYQIDRNTLSYMSKAKINKVPMTAYELFEVHRPGGVLVEYGKGSGRKRKEEKREGRGVRDDGMMGEGKEEIREIGEGRDQREELPGCKRCALNVEVHEHFNNLHSTAIVIIHSIEDFV